MRRVSVLLLVCVAFPARGSIEIAARGFYAFGPLGDDGFYTLAVATSTLGQTRANALYGAAIDAGWRVGGELVVGPSLRYARVRFSELFGGAPCYGQECSGFAVQIGPQATYRLHPQGPLSAWVGVAGGYECSPLTTALQTART